MYINKQSRYYLPIVLIICCLQLAIGIYQKDILEWDEARNGVNAYEMLQRNDYINLYYGNEPDTWNAKPPLMTWCIIALYQLLGYNEWALRLPSAIATLLFFICFFRFTSREEGPLKAFLSCLILLACKAIIGFHAGINGDFDTMLSLFLLLSAISFITYIRTGAPPAAYGAAIFTGLAFYTKGTAAFLFLPGFALYAIITGNFKSVLTNKHTWLAALLLIGITGSWFFIALANAPQYTHSTYGSSNSIETMLVHDTFRRLTSNNFDDKNVRNYLFFLATADVRFNIWNYIFYLSSATGLWLMYKHRTNLRYFINKQDNRLTLFALCVTVPIVVVLNFAVNMHDWYFTPVWGFVAFITTKGMMYYAAKRKAILYLLGVILLFTCTRHFFYLSSLSNEMHHTFTRDNPVFSKEQFVVLTDNPRQNLLLYLHWMNMGFQKVPGEKSGLAGKIVITDKNNIPGYVQPIEYSGNYCIGRIK